ncbi:acetoacetate--CoA ligase [Dictyobacter aurantiacus]|uniref:Acetoacetyl-CoA synthetase n=1 Tax=Dictyobacter aurantiacus TaxID=1936993 RepID=A0A401ZSY9_9CHLR|nr:acetoacetate--CoA ligase [Dictyobacter aurantiacus]GCE09900.1 acetoacetyl-CoA synthetase [Dictyobacter aurantiacus]
MEYFSEENTVLWEASEKVKQRANLTDYMYWLKHEKGLQMETPEQLWRWSVDRLEDFWDSIWQYMRIQASEPYTQVLMTHWMPGAEWFVGARLNYAEQVFRHATADRPALLVRSESQSLREVSWQQLQRQVGSVANGLKALGVGVGDRVVAYVPNSAEAVIAFLACASIGATWSSCAPDFGIKSVVDRFQQIEPCVLFAIDGYRYSGKELDRRATVAELRQALPTLRKTIIIPSVYAAPQADSDPATLLWDELLAYDDTLTYAQVAFNHPLWVLYSSGTTGLPKAIVQSQGGILLEHIKFLHLHMDLKPEDRFFWFTTTGWMMWNLLVGGLLVGCTIVLYDGSPNYPDIGALWELVQEAGITIFGTSAGYLTACMKAGITPAQTYQLTRLRALGSTGSPLPPEGFSWVYQAVKQDLWLTSISGGTDVCSAFVGGSILLPVYAGEIQTRALGAKVEAFDEQGRSVVNEVGELVIREPLPSMPIYFWNDPQGQRLYDSYFATYPGTWRHGDWIQLTDRGSVIISGRSDSTINRKGIRMGSSEIYRTVEDLPEVVDSLVIGVELPGGAYYMPLFVVLKDAQPLSEELIKKIKTRLRSTISPHYVPDTVIAVQEIPRTLSGKKLEVPVKKLFLGQSPEKVASRDTLSNPSALDEFIAIATQFRSTLGATVGN